MRFLSHLIYLDQCSMNRLAPTKVEEYVLEQTVTLASEPWRHKDSKTDLDIRVNIEIVTFLD